jgi:hypothetical protein
MAPRLATDSVGRMAPPLSRWCWTCISRLRGIAELLTGWVYAFRPNPVCG